MPIQNQNLLDKVQVLRLPLTWSKVLCPAIFPVMTENVFHPYLRERERERNKTFGETTVQPMNEVLNLLQCVNSMNGNPTELLGHCLYFNAYQWQIPPFPGRGRFLPICTILGGAESWQLIFDSCKLASHLVSPDIVRCILWFPTASSVDQGYKNMNHTHSFGDWEGGIGSGVILTKKNPAGKLLWPSSLFSGILMMLWQYPTGLLSLQVINFLLF